MTREKMREIVMQLIFQAEAQKDMEDGSAYAYIQEKIKGNANKEYAKKLYVCWREHISEIDSVLDEASNKWRVGRMPRIDLAVLRVAATEILYMDETPDAVAVNEAVELAKHFGTEGSAKFINGLLGKVIKNKNADE